MCAAHQERGHGANASVLINEPSLAGEPRAEIDLLDEEPS